MNRRAQREKVFKLLFRVEFNDIEEMDGQAQHFLSEEMDLDENVSEEILEKITARVDEIIAKLPELDGLIADNLTGWTIDRIGKIELTILRLAVFEIKYDEGVPTSVAINEAVELSKKYGQDDSGAFVNGVLAKFAS